VLYLENSTDLAILRAFARVLNHDAQKHLDGPFVHYVETNLPQRARDHFHGLREAKQDLVGVAIFDRLDKELQPTEELNELMWRRREIENYFCIEDVLLAYARHEVPDDVFSWRESEKRVATMRKAIAEVSGALKTLSKPDPWSPDIKASDDFLDPLFRAFFQALELPLQLRKSEYHILATLVPPDRLDKEVAEKLDAIVRTAERARPRLD
jgi:hypothetical protein